MLSHTLSYSLTLSHSLSHSLILFHTFSHSLSGKGKKIDVLIFFRGIVFGCLFFNKNWKQNKNYLLKNGSTLERNCLSQKDTRETLFFYYNKKNLGTLLELAMPLSIFKVNVHFPYHSLTTYIEQWKKIKEIQNMISKG